MWLDSKLNGMKLLERYRRRIDEICLKLYWNKHLNGINIERQKIDGWNYVRSNQVLENMTLTRVTLQMTTYCI